MKTLALIFCIVLLCLGCPGENVATDTVETDTTVTTDTGTTTTQEPVNLYDQLLATNPPDAALKSGDIVWYRPDGVWWVDAAGVAPTQKPPGRWAQDRVVP